MQVIKSRLDDPEGHFLLPGQMPPKQRAGSVESARSQGSDLKLF